MRTETTSANGGPDRGTKGLAPRMAKLAGLALLIVAALPGCLCAQTGRFEVGADYNYFRSNAPPGGCGCFAMNGGDGWVGWRFTDNFAVVGQVGAQRASGINGTSADLTLLSFLAGPRLTLRPSHLVRPFAQALYGAAHASGLLTPSPTGTAASATVFAVNAGGGIDVGPRGGHISVRAVEVDYLFTQFNNGVNQRQNNLRVSAGIFFHFGAAR
jgi:outer membrane immunogenic protein